jgi:hypothetical protein
MVFAFQSSVSLMSNSCRSRSRDMRWDRVLEGLAAVSGDQAFDLLISGSGGGIRIRSLWAVRTACVLPFAKA